MGRPLIKVGVATVEYMIEVVDHFPQVILGGSGWIRLQQWLRHSSNHTVFGNLKYGTHILGVQPVDGGLHFDAPVIIMQRHAEAAATSAVQRAVQNGQRVINDIDDWYWGLHEENMAAKFFDPSFNSEYNYEHYRRTLEASSLVVVSTPFLAERLAEWGINVRLIQNCVSTDLYPMREHRVGPVTVGWAGSTGHRSGDLDILREPFARLPESVRFHHTGDDPGHPAFTEKVALDPGRVSFLPLQEPEQYPYSFIFDIGVVPLVDHPFNHAKSWIKGIEYAAAGVPFVASPSPEYLRLKAEYGIGRIARSADEWVEHIEELMDPAVRYEEAQRQRQLVVEHLDVRRMAASWDDAVWG